MKTRKIRLLSALLALAMLLALLPTAAFAEGESTYYTYQWNADHKVTFSYTLDSENNATITGAGADLPADGVVEIPEKIESYNVTAIGGSAFYRRTDLKEIDLKSATHLTSIGDAAFRFASALTTVTLPEASLQTIGGSAFNNCTALKSINIPSTVTAIGGWCFQNCYGLEEVTFAADSKLTTIQGGTFINCNGLKTITIPKSVKLINRENANGAFSGCSALESVTFEPGSHLKTIEGSTFSYCSSLKTITIPQSVERIQTYINVGAFSGCSALESVIFEPDSKLITVDSGAFGYNGNITFYYSDKDEKVKTALTNGGVSKGKIQSLDALNPVVTFDVDGEVDVFGQQNAKDHNFKAVKPENNPIKDGWNFIGWYTKNEDNEYKPFDFNTTITEDITLYARWTASGTCGDNLTWTLDDSGTLTISGMGAMADYDNADKQPWANQRSSINKVVIGDGVTSIGENAFANCPGLKAVELPPNGVLETIKYNAFSWVHSSSEVSAGITEITIPKSVITIEKYAFDGCTKLATVTFAPNSKLETIGRMTFQGTAISEISIPASVKTIGNSVFNKCLNLTKVIFESPSSLENVSSNTFVGCSNATIYYSDETAKNVLSKVVSPDRIKPANPTVTFISNGGSEVKPATVKNENTISAPAVPTRKGWDFAGWYTKDANDKWADEAFNFNTPIKNDMTLYARWATALVPITPAVELYPITIDYGTAYDADHNVITKAAKGETVYVEASETALDGMTFERWEVRKGEVKLENDRAAETTFTMPAGEVQLEAMYQAADVHDSGWDAATVVTGVAIGTGTAILVYHVGMEVYAEQVLGKDVAVPRTRAEVALLAWQLAGSPAVNVEGEPLSEAAQAERWAVESGLMQLDADGSFNGTKKMSKWNALRTLEKAKQ